MEDIGHLFEGHSLSISRVRHRPDHPEGSVADGSVGLDVELWLQMVLLVVMVVVMVSFHRRCLHLSGRGGSSGSWSLPRGRRGEVWLLLPGVQHDSSAPCGGVLLERVHGRSGDRSLQGVLWRVVVLQVRGGQVLQRVVVVGHG